METFSGIDYLKIDIASNFGLDKKSWSERISWFDQNASNLDDLVSQADEPALFFAGVRAYRQTLNGLPTGYLINLDATSSGFQILACLVGDNHAAELCNVVDIGIRADAYTIIYEDMLSQVGETAKISRDDCKQAIMTSCYGSTAMPKVVFGDGPLLQCFHSTMERRAPAVWELNQVMLAAWDPEALSHDWIMPDNYHVHIKIMGTVMEPVHFLNRPYEVPHRVNRSITNGRSLCANMTHSIDGMIVREMVRRCSYHPPTIQYVRQLLDNSPIYGTKEITGDDKLVVLLWRRYKQSGYLSARILDHLTADNMGHVEPEVIRDLILSLPEYPFQILPIHDCFRCHPNYGNDLRRQYNIQLHSIAKSNMLSYLLSQIMLREIEVGKLDDSMADKILHTNYALS
jgi:hypothetical protein